ncbi:hypothetical protein C6N75_04680 [Streptomyces solincola]|uniref:Uncharacterized protein n=1 Tax=Streptomyces solincola TaxID=2100817 RepID=A0A2S9Q0Z9_9ACTN|nr:hypothetical protein [Streptomyces solincola]PRH80354.1 hypothetical protein C6N75_04680 [Streptomyces solincola]
MATNETSNHPAHCDVTVQLSDCGRQDAHAVFASLDRVFAACDPVDPGETHTGGAEPTVWMATFDSGSARGEGGSGGEPPALGTRVNALLTGDAHAVDEVEKALARIFEVHSTESVSGEHEREARLQLGPR